ncbi:glycosyltransferase [Methylobacterium oryzihabitans]|uniref:Glycosyl transferase family 8 n=1 Tax=Methylobacterium oryzihabitans TaxID=2499852 RepID=A0A3S2XJ78_9HYPH|nr:glycosyltransferase [Methylobacterium oryzihabitans]RVU16121.1 hypothetical protein EOE48_17345 [Methylobacterium oryzihabitans]
MRLRKWYFATNAHGLQKYWEQLQVSVLSARRHTNLEPYCLLDKDGQFSEIEDRIQSLKNHGVNIIHHQSSIYPIVKNHFKMDQDIYSGHWLRLDIPNIEAEDDFILYTDIDVMFRGPIAEAMEPSYIACAPEHRRDDFTYFNSGVMIMNTRNLRSTWGQLRQTVIDRLNEMQPHDDQGALNVCYRDRYDRLPNEWNWKPYWGPNQEAVITHFHGPKPFQIRDILTGIPEKRPIDELVDIYHRSPEGYDFFLKEADRYRIPIER